MSLEAVYRSCRIPISTTLIGALVFVSIVFTAGDASATPRFADEEYYRGIILAQGPVAANVPEIRDMFGRKLDPQAARALHELHDRLIQTVREQDPSFMGRFARAMQSGDHFTIDEMITEGAKATVRAIRAMPEIVTLKFNIEQDPQYVTRLLESMRKADKNVNEAGVRRAIQLLVTKSFEQEWSALEDGEIGDPSTNTIVFLALATYLAVVHAVAVVFSLFGAVAISLVMAGPSWDDPGMLLRGTLLREQIVHSIATRFSR